MAEILIENVSKSYVSKDGSVQALKNVNLAIEQKLHLWMRKLRN